MLISGSTQDGGLGSSGSINFQTLPPSALLRIKSNQAGQSSCFWSLKAVFSSIVKMDPVVGDIDATRLRCISDDEVDEVEGSGDGYDGLIDGIR